MNAPTTNLAILFADISGSTALYDKHGDTMASNIIASCINIMSDELAEQQGTLVKTIGDEIMCTFPSAEAALKAACRMQLAVETGKPGGNLPIYIHIGFHYGSVICSGTDVYGDAVNIAARMTEMTRAREITTTQATVDVLPPGLIGKVRKVFRTAFKGKQEEFDVYRVVWELDDTMSTRVGMLVEHEPSAGHAELLLQYRGRAYKVNEQKRSMVLGRGQDCELVICDNLASRQHARVEFRLGKFVLVDHSANGTYVRFREGQIIRLFNEQTALHGSGTISLGQPFSEAPGELVEFVLS